MPGVVRYFGAWLADCQASTSCWAGACVERSWSSCSTLEPRWTSTSTGDAVRSRRWWAWSGRTTLPGKRGDEIETEVAAGDLAAGDLDLLVIAGGYGPDKLRLDEGLLQLVRDLDGQGKTIAFICHGGWVPVSAGIVEGRRMTGNPSIEDDVRNAGAQWEDSEVVVDGNLVSSRNPDDLPAFMRATIEVAAHAEAPA